MTAQFPETITYEGQTRTLLSRPLCDYFSLSKTPSPFRWTTTALWRGYLGKWEVIEGRLYLNSVKAGYEENTTTSLPDIFPSFSKRVFAHWYTGELRIPIGEMVTYQHMGFGQTYEQDILLEVKQGVIKSKTIRDNK